MNSSPASVTLIEEQFIIDFPDEYVNELVEYFMKYIVNLKECSSDRLQLRMAYPKAESMCEHLIAVLNKRQTIDISMLVFRIYQVNATIYF